jgi:hypothetical protein
MLDKYKKLAQDAQHNGDRVQMEYYLQFADHYFRVIADNKARADEQRGDNRRNDERETAEDFEDDFDFGRRNDTPTRSPYEQPENIGNTDVSEGEPGQEGENFLSDERGADRGEAREDNHHRGQRRQQQQRRPRDGGDRVERGDRRAERPERPKRAERPEQGEAKPARGRKPRKPADDGERSGSQGGIDSAVLPPSIRGDDAGGDRGSLETVD